MSKRAWTRASHRPVLTERALRLPTVEQRPTQLPAAEEIARHIAEHGVIRCAPKRRGPSPKDR